MKQPSRRRSPNQHALWSRFQLIDWQARAARHGKTSDVARPCTGRRTSGKAKIHRELPRWIAAAQRLFSAMITRSAQIGREITQIYEGTNQIQKVVMARALLKG
nr:hypothetical protein [Amycolatopsis nivea]